MPLFDVGLRLGLPTNRFPTGSPTKIPDTSLILRSLSQNSQTALVWQYENSPWKHKYKAVINCPLTSEVCGPHSGEYINCLLWNISIVFYGITNRCDNVQWNLFLCKSTLHVSGGTHAHHQEYNLNCYTAIGTIHTVRNEICTSNYMYT